MYIYTPMTMCIYIYKVCQVSKAVACSSSRICTNINKEMDRSTRSTSCKFKPLRWEIPISLMQQSIWSEPPQNRNMFTQVS